MAYTSFYHLQQTTNNAQTMIDEHHQQTDKPAQHQAIDEHSSYRSCMCKDKTNSTKGNAKRVHWRVDGDNAVKQSDALAPSTLLTDRKNTRWNAGHVPHCPSLLPKRQLSVDIGLCPPRRRCSMVVAELAAREARFELCNVFI
jgi:hypothetical protein